MAKVNELIDLVLVQYHETDKAFLLGESEQKKVWIPKSRCERGPLKGREGAYEVYEFTIEGWIAEEKGLI